MEPDRKERLPRPYAFDKMEGLVRKMQDPDKGVPVRSQKLFLTSIPSAFMGYDLIEWLMDKLGIEESEALNLANQLCQYGYFFPVSDSKNLVVKDDSSLYRFQSAYYWPWQNRPPDNIEYAIYLAKRTLRNKQRHGLEDYELEMLANLRRNLANKWDFVTIQAEEQVREEKAKLQKVMKKGDKIVNDSQERAYWRVHRPPPGMVSSLEQVPIPNKTWNGSKPRKKTLDDYKREVELLKNSLTRTRIKVSQALESMVHYVETYTEYDAMITGVQPSNPWVSEDLIYWQLNSPLVETPTEKRVRRWALSMEELVSDPTGLQEFTNYLRKEYSHENIRFWMAVNDLRRSAQSQIPRKVQEIYEKYLAPGAPCEINIDGKTMEKVQQEMKNPSRFTFDAAQEHVYTLLLKKDCYPRFIRSEYYKNLLAAGVLPSTKKRFFGFGQTKKKSSTSSAPNSSLVQQQQSSQSGAGVACGGALSKRRGSDRSISGSAHELAVSGVRDTRVPHSHSQSNLSEIPYRVKKPGIVLAAGASTSEDVCPWEAPASESRSRKNSAQLDSGSSSSDISIETLERLTRRSCTLTQQNTLDGTGGGGRLTANASVEPRRASVSVAMTYCPEPEPPERKTPVLTKACSVSGANPPTISVTDEGVATQEVNEVIEVAEEEEEVEEKDEEGAVGISEIPNCFAQPLSPLAPLAEPDSESPGSELPPDGEEAKANDVCPWEDEEACKEDTPFVKTYATLGYL